MSLRISKRLEGDVAVLDASGRVTFAEGANELRDTIRKVLDEGSRKVLLNLEDVSYIDSAGIERLVLAWVTAQNVGGSLKLLNLTKKVHDLLHITRLISLFDVFQKEEEALRSFEASPMYCLCPVCKHPSQPSVFDKREWWSWPPQACGSCASRFELQSSQPSRDQAVVKSVRLQTYENEYLNVLSGSPFTIEIVGRLNLFASSALERAWKALPTPRRILFDLQRATEISDAGRNTLLALLANSEKDTKATIAVEGLDQQQMRAFPIEPPVYSSRAGALAALGDVSDTPAWRIQVVRS